MDSDLIENLVILLDNTKSTANKDFKPSRFHVALKGVKYFIETVNKVDPNSFISLFVFGKETTILSGLTQNTNVILNQIASKKFVKNHPPAGDASELTFAIENATQILTDQFKLIGGQSSRIFLITDSYDFHLSSEIENLIPKLQRFHIKFDVIVFSEKKHKVNEAEYRKIVDKTNGNFLQFHSKKDLLNGIKSYALRNKTSEKKFHLIQPKNSRDHLEEIAQFLRFPNDVEFQEVRKRNSTLKCQICFTRKSPINGISFFNTGRFCPHCDKPMHLHCAGVWAQKSAEEENIFRCPYCYTL
jgi:hypothetical protein